MARRESKATGGFFPTPNNVLRSITSALRVQGSNGIVRVMDPCAGDGRALRALSNLRKRDTYLYGCEMERGRWRAAQLGLHSSNLLRGDFFQVKCGSGFFQVIFLNPPYDQDRETKRLEERFLRAVVPMLAEGGVLVFVVPHYSLSASASTLAQHFEDVQVYRFPEPEFSMFKQIVLFGRRRRSLEADAQVEARLLDVARDATLAPVLTGDLSYTPMVANDWANSSEWRLEPYDPTEVETLHPWESERGPVPGLAHPLDLSCRIGQVYPVIMPPRPVHLAAALAAGVFNGIHVHPDPESSHLPALLLKGTFERTWSTVDQKFDKDGDLASETQIEKPVLTVWALDLSSAQYHQLRASGDLTDPQQVEGMTLGDLLDSYSVSLLDQLRAACPVLHDPHRDFEQPVEGLARPLWPAQTSALLALGKSLDQGRGGLIVGEVGTGKTSIALALAKQRGHAKVLVICPPHLLGSWADQVRYVVPEYRTVVLDALADVGAVVAHPQPTVALLSRERAKLGHGWRDLKRSRCPRCGQAPQGGVTGMAEKRGRCPAITWTSDTPLATWFHRHRHLLARLAPTHPAIGMLLGTSRATKRLLDFAVKHPATSAHRQELDEALIELFGTDHAGRQMVPGDGRSALVMAAWTSPTAGARGLALLGIPERGERDGFELRQRVALCLDFDTVIEPFHDPNSGNDYGYSEEYRASKTAESWREWAGVRARVHKRSYSGHASYWRYQGFDEGTYRSVPRGSDKALDLLLTDLWEAADFQPRPCSEPLYQAEGPCRYPLATWIARKMPHAFDLLVVDEAHEYGAEDSAQGIAAARLARAHKGDLLYMTGSLVNGYASSAFNVLHAVSPEFRHQFKPDQRDAFVDRYGLRKRVLVYKDAKKTELRFGAHSERRLVGAVKKGGEAPGVLPVFLLEHLLRSAATLQKADLELALPSTSEEAIEVPLAPKQERHLSTLLEVVKDTIAKTRFTAGLAGKLFGALVGLVSYPDRAACGPYTVDWPESAGGLAGQVVVSVPSLDPTTLWPKERWLLDAIAEERAEGRRVLVAPTHTPVATRLSWLCEQAGIEAVTLHADKVPPSKRERWLNEKLVAPGRGVLIANPTTIQTGLNNLVVLSTVIWYENPECNPIRYRQANGRLDRPGQLLPVRFRFPLYQHPLVRHAYRLLMHKVGISLAADGLDPDAVLQAAGVESEFAAGLSVGHQLYRMLVEQAQRT